MAESNPIHASSLESGKASLAANADQQAETEADLVIEAIGSSYWQYALTFVMAVLFAADSVEVSLLSFLYECVGAAFDLSTVRASSVVSIVFVGMIIGALGAGALADQVGRKAISLVSILMVSAFGVLSALAENFDAFVALRFFVGVFIGTFAVPFDLLAEMVPALTRGRALVWMQVGWALGAMYACAAAWIALPASSWRSLTLACSVPPAVTFLALLYFLDESPRFLILNGRRGEAAAIFKRIAAKNGVAADPVVVDAIARVEAGANAAESTGYSLAVARRKFATILEPALLWTTLPVWVIWFSFGLVYYGLTLVVTRVYGGGSDDDDDGFTCSFSYGLIFAIFSSELAGSLCLVPAIDSFGRVNCQVFTYLAVAVAATPVGLGVTSGPLCFTCLYVALGAATAASSATWVHVTELYPTEVRSTAHTTAYVVSRFGAFSSGYITAEDVPLSAAVFVLVAFSVVAAIASRYLPETTSMRLD